MFLNNQVYYYLMPKRKYKSKKMNPLDWISFILIVIGAINWGFVGIPQLFGLSQINLVSLVLGTIPFVENIVYGLVGISGVYWLFRAISLR